MKLWPESNIPGTAGHDLAELRRQLRETIGKLPPGIGGISASVAVENFRRAAMALPKAKDIMRLLARKR